MKPWSIMLAAVLAFAGLCAAGFWWLRPQPSAPAPLVLPAPLPPEPAPSVHVPPPAARMHAPLPEPHVIAPALPTTGSPPPRHPAYAPLPPEVLPASRFRIASDPVQALAPLVHECFSDARSQYRGKLSATLRFTPLPDGGIAQGSVTSLSVQDPYLEACLEDAMSDARFAPGEESDAIEHTFIFGAEDGGSGAGLR